MEAEDVDCYYNEWLALEFAIKNDNLKKLIHIRKMIGVKIVYFTTQPEAVSILDNFLKKGLLENEKNGRLV